MSNAIPRHTPFPWARHDDGGMLPGVYVKRGGFRYGPEAADWIWGPKGPGYGVVADCSPHGPATEESIANARLISALPELIAALEACIAEFRFGARADGKGQAPLACDQAIAALDLAFGRPPGSVNPEGLAGIAQECRHSRESAR
jgi:hypothetical protein